jgi:glyoxylase-like metal-dependent hydrolase (beta-lactamase superfamily II)
MHATARSLQENTMNSNPIEKSPLTSPLEPLAAFPAPGIYDVAQMITLLSSSPAAEIYYTLDGSLPTPSSLKYDPYRLIAMQEFGQPARDGRRTFTIRAMVTIGDRSSTPQTFAYQVDPRSKDVYISQELAPGLRMICDYENDKMYLLTGSQRALLIDCGMGSGDLRGYIESFTGGLPLDVVITHAHPDHIARMGQFQADCNVYMHLDDLPMVKSFIERLHYEIDPEKIKDMREGFVFELGDRQLRVYHLPGHSKGSIVLLDEQNGILFAGDAVGSNRPTIVDALWLQRSEDTIDVYLFTLQAFRAKVAGKIKFIYGGHNDACLLGEAYLDHLQEAAQRLLDLGTEVLVPSPRPSGVWQVVSGDRLSDPNWAAINVDREKCLPSR